MKTTVFWSFSAIAAFSVITACSSSEPSAEGRQPVAADQGNTEAPATNEGKAPGADVTTVTRSDADAPAESSVADATPDGAKGDAGPDASTPVEAGPPPVSFAKVYTTVLEDNCSGCHGERGSAGLNLSTQSAAYTALVGVKAAGRSCNDGKRVLVVAGDPAASLLYAKVNQTQDCGRPMPPSGPLAAEDVALIRDWIAGGALP